MTYSSVAILIDGDNVSSLFAGQILRKTADLGPHRQRLAFCNAQSIADWSSASSFRVVHSGAGKNGSDIVLSINAIEFALRDGIEAFAIVSSDGDLSHVAHKLRELGRHVVGFGEDKAPKSFRLACNRFQLLTPPPAKVDEKKLDPVDIVVREVLKEQDPGRTGIPVARLNGLVRHKDKGIKISEHPDKTWPRYLRVRTDLYEVIDEGANRRVRVASAQDGA